MILPARRKYQGPDHEYQQYALTPVPANLTSLPLTEVETGELPMVSQALAPLAPISAPLNGVVSDRPETFTETRQPVVIHGTGKRRTPAGATAAYPTHKRPLFIVGAVFLSLMVIFTVMAYTVPVGTNKKPLLGSLSQPKINIAQGRSNTEDIDIASQAITATAISEASTIGYTYVSGVIETNNPDDQVHLNRFAAGNCTYWSNYRYHQLTGVWVPWLGNAYEWYGQAIAYGWHYSDYPNPKGPSILVMAPWTMGNGALGHVAIAEKINGDGTVLTSNWNWGPQNWGVTTYMDVPYPTPGLHYVWI